MGALAHNSSHFGYTQVYTEREHKHMNPSAQIQVHRKLTLLCSQPLKAYFLAELTVKLPMQLDMNYPNNEGAANTVLAGTHNTSNNSFP